MAWCWFNATESKPHNVGSRFIETQKKHLKMKKIIQIIILFCALHSFSQTIIKVEPDEDKNKYFSLYLLDENDIMKSLGFKDNNGFNNLNSLKLDSLKTYRLYLDDSRFIKIDKILNLKSKDTLIIKLKPNPNCNCKTFPKDVLVMNCPYYNFGAYIAKEPRNLDELPLLISTKVKDYLKSRVGKKFYNNIYFKKGQIIDSIPYKKYFENSKMETRYHYFLCFAFSNLEKGIGEYTSNIELDEFGNIINDIKLPKKNKDINRLVSLNKIKNKAILEKFYIQDKTKIEMNYDFKKNILIWKFINEEYKPSGKYYQKELIFNAHNGKYIELKINEGTWVE